MTGATPPTGTVERAITEAAWVIELRAVFAELRDFRERAEESRARGGDHEAQLALVWSRREIEQLAERFEGAVYDGQADAASAWDALSEEEADNEQQQAALREEIAVLSAGKEPRRAAWLALKSYRRECEARLPYGEAALAGEDWRLTEARVALFAAFDAL